MFLFSVEILIFFTMLLENILMLIAFQEKNTLSYFYCSLSFSVFHFNSALYLFKEFYC